jgi:Universal stress protein family.
MNLTPVPSLVPGTDSVGAETPRPADHLGGECILVPLLTADARVTTDQLRVAASLARTTCASLHVVTPFDEEGRTVPESGGELTVEEEQALVEWATDGVFASTPAGGQVGYTHELVSSVLSWARADSVNALVVPSGSAAGRLRCGVTERLGVHADCDVITVNGRHGYEQVPSMLLAVADGPHSALAADIAARVAADCDAWIDVLHVVGRSASGREREQAETRVEAAARRIGRPESTATWVLGADDVAATIAEQSAYYGLTVIGAPTKGRLRQLVFGSTNQDIRSDARSVVISARRRTTTTTD